MSENLLCNHSLEDRLRAQHTSARTEEGTQVPRKPLTCENHVEGRSASGR